jgi:hypothetical protein
LEVLLGVPILVDKKVLGGAWKNAVSSFCAVILSNVIDPQAAVISWRWARHVLVVGIIVVVINEARYWKTWADKPDDNTPVVISFFLSFFFSLAAQLIFRASGGF